MCIRDRGTCENRGRQHIVRKTMGQLRDHICGSRGNEDNVRRLRKGNMFNGKLKVPVKRIHQMCIRDSACGSRSPEGQRRKQHRSLNCGHKMCIRDSRLSLCNHTLIFLNFQQIGEITGIYVFYYLYEAQLYFSGVHSHCFSS